MIDIRVRQSAAPEPYGEAMIHPSATRHDLIVTTIIIFIIMRRRRGAMANY